MRRHLIIAGLLLALSLGVVEGVAYWWMHPAPAGLGQPVLVYRPGSAKELSGKSQPPAPGLTPDNRQPTTDDSPPSTTTPLPDIVTKALPSLRCSTGTAARIDRDDDVTLHVAFFEWDLTSSTSVLEAFKHLPEECMGSIGMTLVEKAPVRTFVVRGQGTGGRGQEEGDRSQGTEVRGQEQNQKSAINNQQSSISPSSLSTLNPQLSTSSPLLFDHTIFRDQTGAIIHAFKGTWVSGTTDLLGEGVRGGVELWNQIRRNAAFKRFRPAHARVVQGAVRGIPNPDLAWEAFEEAMLRDLSFQ